MVLLAVSAAIGSVFYYQHWQINSLQNDVVILSENNTKLKSAVETQKQTVSSLEGSLFDAIQNSKALAKRLVDVDEKRQLIVEELNSYRGRLENVAFRKPTLVESRVNDAAANVLQQFDKATRNQN